MPRELWSLLNFIEPDKFDSADDFADEFGEMVKATEVRERVVRFARSRRRAQLARSQRESVSRKLRGLQFRRRRLCAARFAHSQRVPRSTKRASPRPHAVRSPFAREAPRAAARDASPS